MDNRDGATIASQRAVNPTGAAARTFGGLAAVLLALAVVLGGCWLLYRSEARQIAERQEELETVRVNLLTQLLRSELRPVVEDVRLLADGDGFRRYIESGAPEALQAATRRAAFVSREKPLYDEVRYIDEHGQEVIRINRGGAIVPATQLQNRANRAFFQQANALPEGSLYISSFDLNPQQSVQSGQLRPTLRFAVPVFDTKGSRRGIYIINCGGDSIIAVLQQATPVLVKRVRLLNAQGYWLKAADASHEWGFQLAGRAAFTLARSDPALWAQMQADPTGQAHDHHGLITWQRIRPQEFAQTPDGGLHANDAFLIVASSIAEADWDAFFGGLRSIMLAAAAALTALTLLSAWLLRSRIHAIQALRTANEDLERRVRARTEELARSYEQIQYREEWLEESGRLANVGGWEWDPATGQGSWTPEVARIHDLDPAVDPSKSIGLHYYPGESRTRLEAALHAAVTQATPYDLDLEMITATGARKWVRTICKPVLENGKVVRLRGAMQDVTRRKRGEARLQAQLQRLHMLEHITRAIGDRQDLPSIMQVVVRTLEEEAPLDFGCMCLYEPTERTLTVMAIGVASEALAEQLAMTRKAHIQIDENGLSRCVGGQLVYEPDIAGLAFPFPERLASGGLRALVAAPLQIESQVFGVLICARRQPDSFTSGECEFIRQLSEHVALAAHQARLHGALQTAYEELRATQQSVMQQERLRVLGQMASGIAHDINNAISPVTLYTDALLENETGLSERGRSYLKTIQQATSDVAETVARMREFYRQRENEGPHLPLDLNEIVPQVVELTRARWGAIPQQRGVVIQVRTELTPELPTMTGVKSEIREALTNLIFNAVDAMPQGGTLTLRTRNEGGRRVTVEVVDTGVGMDEETRRRCLEPFFTTKGERGTGLGLAMVWGVVQRHSGDLDIESKPGAGTTVRLSFAAETTVSTAATDIQAAPAFGLSILLIDDDPILLKSLRETLELDGHKILTANNGKQGLELFRNAVHSSGRATVSVVITDLGMPHVDGHSVARGVKQVSPATPLILLTGWGERLLAEGGLPPNVDRVLSKPPRLRELRQALAELTAGDPARH